MLKSIFRKLFVLSLLIISVGLVGRTWYFCKDGFNVNRLHYSLPFDQKLERGDSRTISSSGGIGSSLHGGVLQNENVDCLSVLLNDTYHYLGRGRQCYVFASSDGRYVLKLPRFDRYRLPFFWQAMPSSFMSSYKKSLYDGRQERLVFTLESFRIAADLLQEETAVVYLHLHRTNSLPRQFVIYDRLNRPLAIDLNQTAFALQEKKAIMMPLCIKAFKDRNSEAAKKMLLSFLEIIDVRAQKGIFNRDPSFLKNFGWDGEKSVQIDIGSFWRRSDLSKKEAHLLSLKEGTAPFRQWLAITDPEMSDWFERQFALKMQLVESNQEPRG